MPSKFALLKNVHRCFEIVRCVRETEQWPQVIRCYLGGHSLSYPWTLRIQGLHGVEVREATDVSAFWQVFLRRVYNVRGDERAIVDAGANIGFFTLWAAKSAPQATVVAIEPAPESYQRLCENVQLNGLQDRVLCLDVALAGLCTTRMVRLGRPKSQARRVLPYDANTSDNIARVSTATLADIFEQHAIFSIDLLKMDIEGAEYETLLSSSHQTLRRIRRLALEYHPNIEQYTTDQLLRHLRDAGFVSIKDIHNSKGFGVVWLENAAFSGVAQARASEVSSVHKVPRQLVS